jgi:hypothetical protein
LANFDWKKHKFKSIEKLEIPDETTANVLDTTKHSEESDNLILNESPNISQNIQFDISHSCDQSDTDVALTSNSVSTRSSTVLIPLGQSLLQLNPVINDFQDERSSTSFIGTTSELDSDSLPNGSGKLLEPHQLFQMIERQKENPELSDFDWKQPRFIRNKKRKITDETDTTKHSEESDNLII